MTETEEEEPKLVWPVELTKTYSFDLLGYIVSLHNCCEAGDLGGLDLLLHVGYELVSSAAIGRADWIDEAHRRYVAEHQPEELALLEAHDVTQNEAAFDAALKNLLEGGDK